MKRVFLYAGGFDMYDNYITSQAAAITRLNETNFGT